VRIAREPDATPGDRDIQHRVEELPPELLQWLLASRLCESDTLADRAWELFGDTLRGPEHVAAICDWIHGNIEYGVPSVVPTTVGARGHLPPARAQRRGARAQGRRRVP
jgi:transglutaminase-like putative cysteine protease